MSRPPPEVYSEILSEANRDDVGLWFIIGCLQDECDIIEPGALRRETMRCVEWLLGSEMVVAGTYGPHDGRFHRWSGSTEDILARIDSEWSALGRRPTIGEIVVFLGHQALNRREC
jgi:hypothetical protein